MAQSGGACLFCGGDLAAPDHWRRCDGRQGRIEADEARYPDAAGFKRAGTSAAAAATIDAPHLRGLVWHRLQQAPATADEIAADLGIDRLSIRPRCSELVALGAIGDSGARRLNASGHRAIVWQVTEGADRWQ